jgi:hypothetical protein
MGTAAVVPNPENIEESSSQGRSTIRFPYLDQDDAIDVAKKIFEIGGKSCDKFALAAALNVKADAGGFNLRVGTAKMFGLISGEKKMLHLTPLGSRVLDPKTEKGARIDSFMAVPLYKAIFSDYEGQMLPANPGLETHIEKLGVAPKQKDKARQVFQRSATQAGYFAFGNNRLVAPQLKPANNIKTTEEPEESPVDKTKGGNGSGGNNGGNDGDKDKKKRHPFIEGLLDTLPPTGTDKAEWSIQGRHDWLQTAAGIFNLIYKTTAEDKGNVTVSIDGIKTVN